MEIVFRIVYKVQTMNSYISCVIDRRLQHVLTKHLVLTLQIFESLVEGKMFSSNNDASSSWNMDDFLLPLCLTDV